MNNPDVTEKLSAPAASTPASGWKEGDEDESPSSGWDNYKPGAKKRTKA